tara:strand:+ start:175 stop:402 length:228 start_codon:yes stop_codon:yes gene_type:complete
MVMPSHFIEQEKIQGHFVQLIIRALVVQLGVLRSQNPQQLGQPQNVLHVRAAVSAHRVADLVPRRLNLKQSNIVL